MTQTQTQAETAQQRPAIEVRTSTLRPTMLGGYVVLVRASTWYRWATLEPPVVESLVAAGRRARHLRGRLLLASHPRLDELESLVRRWRAQVLAPCVWIPSVGIHVCSAAAWDDVQRRATRAAAEISDAAEAFAAEYWPEIVERAKTCGVDSGGLAELWPSLSDRFPADPRAAYRLAVSRLSLTPADEDSAATLAEEIAGTMRRSVADMLRTAIERLQSAERLSPATVQRLLDWARTAETMMVVDDPALREVAAAIVDAVRYIPDGRDNAGRASLAARLAAISERLPVEPERQFED